MSFILGYSIQVNDGYCFNITKKQFLKNPTDLEGSPRKFVPYDSQRVPNPKPFLDGIRNSFPHEDIRMKFFQKFYQLLLHKKFPVKERKLMLIGESNSGKSSWFSVFEGNLFTFVHSTCSISTIYSYFITKACLHLINFIYTLISLANLKIQNLLGYNFCELMKLPLPIRKVLNV